MKAVILAGGKGRRLLPYTTNFPKPLMPVGERPILEIVLGQLHSFGVNDIIISTGHLEELIRVFFGNGEKFGLNISYCKEDEPLGTAGPLNLVKDRLDDTFLVMNGDVLSDVDIRKFIEHHRAQKNIATVLLSKRNVHIDFGVVEITEDNAFKSWNEKPTISYLVSTGIYLFEPEALQYMPEKGFFNLPDFIQAIDGAGKTVGCHVHEGYWLDIGRPEDYERACIEFGDEEKK
jgi:NDP-sugar pyrophosphorylase family protein